MFCGTSIQAAPTLLFYIIFCAASTNSKINKIHGVWNFLVRYEYNVASDYFAVAFHSLRNAMKWTQMNTFVLLIFLAIECILYASTVWCHVPSQQHAAFFGKFVALTVG